MKPFEREWSWILARPRLVLASLSLLCLLTGLFTLPPLDRDESRFAQATKQMLESGDFVEIRFQDEARNKKPVGIYWLQTASVEMLTAAPHNQIWAYRIPSVLGAIASVLLVFAIGQRLFDTPTGVLAGGFMAVCIGLVIEGLIAKTDAVLLATILGCQWAAAQAYLGGKDKAPWPIVATFWLSLGAGILIKGPVAPFIAFGTLITLSIWDRNWRVLKRLRPLVGVLMTLAVILPWGIAIWVQTDGQFFRDALGGDFGGKLVGGQERHGGWPGYYLLLVSVTFWPAIVALIPALYLAWRDRDQAKIRFLLSWIVPAWIVFELIPTKLPHYVLPLYPALAILCALTIQRLDHNDLGMARHWSTRVSIAVFAFVCLMLTGLIVALPVMYGTGVDYVSLVAAIAFLAIAAFTVRILLKGQFLAAALSSFVLGLILHISLFGLVVRQLEAVQVSPRVAKLVETVQQTLNKKSLASSGYAEPSLVFLVGTDTQLGTVDQSAAFLAANPDRIALIERQFDPAFQAAMGRHGIAAIPLGSVSGFNYSKGDPIVLTLYGVRPSGS